NDGIFVESEIVTINSTANVREIVVDVDSVSFDPDSWLLKAVTYETINSTVESITPQQFSISSAYPNPFNPTLSIDYMSPNAQTIVLRAFNISGQLVNQLESFATPGENQLTWNANSFASGIYWIQLSTRTETRTVKAVLLK